MQKNSIAKKIQTLKIKIFDLFQPTPRGSKGKGTNDPVKFLPVLPSKRSKPAWQQNPPSFMLTGQPDQDGATNDRNGIDLIAELTASKTKFTYNKIMST